MRIGAVAGLSSGYSVMSVYGNPKGVEKVSPINKETQAASPLVVVKEEADPAEEILRNIDDVVDYDEVMNQMMGGQALNAYTVPTQDATEGGLGMNNSENDISAFMRNKAIMAYS